jgi:hypothetical protein
MCRKIQETLKDTSTSAAIVAVGWLAPFKSSIKQNGFGSRTCGPITPMVKRIEIIVDRAGI